MYIGPKLGALTRGLKLRLNKVRDAASLHRLREAGVGHAEWTRHCTYGDKDRFYSYRRATHNKEADYGRLIAAITLGHVV